MDRNPLLFSPEGRSLFGSVARDRNKELPILDLGCGSGRPIAKFLARAGYRIVGVDASERLLAEAKKVVPAVCEELGAFGFFERAVLLRGVKKKQERFGFRISTGEEEAACLCDVKIATAVNRKSAWADAARPSAISSTWCLS